VAIFYGSARNPNMATKYIFMAISIVCNVAPVKKNEQLSMVVHTYNPSNSGG
jgi:hypothetical protein